MKTIKKLKGLLKAVVFAMLMVFVLHGCDDEQNVSNESDNHEIMIKHLSENDLLKNDFIKEIADKIKDISTKKNITSSDSTFVIKTKSFYKTTLDSITNYSFLLLRNDKEYGELYYENFIVTEINNVYSFSIAKFNMKNSELLSLETVDSNLVSLQQIIDTTTKMVLMDDCIKVEYLPCDGNRNADGHAAVEGYCHGSATVLDFSDCFGGGSGGSGPSGSSNGSPNQGTGEESTNTNNSSTSSVVWHPSPSSFGATTVVILDYGQNAVDNFFDNLTVNEQNAIPPIIKKKISAYIYSNFSEVNQAGANNTTIFYNIITWLANNNNQSNVLSNCIAILDFLFEDGNNTPEAQAFAQEAMEAMNIDSTITFNQYRSEQIAITVNIVNNIENNATNDAIELYLLAKYNNSDTLNLSVCARGSNTLTIGDYTLTPHYDSMDSNANLVFYAAYRNDTNGIEYIIKESDLAKFQEKIAWYTYAADLVYMNGVPSQGQITYAAGDYFKGLYLMWSDALHSPQWWSYAITSFGTAIVNLPVNSTISSLETSPNWNVSLNEMTVDLFQGKVVTNPQGINVTINIPENYVPRIANNGQGIVFQPENLPVGSATDAFAIRIMQPTQPGVSYPHPKGYVVFHNSTGQPINPLTNQTLPPSNWHFDFP